MKKKRNYDKKVKLTRILLADYLILKSIAQKADISMAQALHRLIEHQAQLPLLDRIEPVRSTRSIGSIQITRGIEPVRVTKGRTPIQFSGNGI